MISLVQCFRNQVYSVIPLHLVGTGQLAVCHVSEAPDAVTVDCT
jgi:hypothetical protein